MKVLYLLTFLFAFLMPMVSAWQIRLWNHPDYKDLILSRSGESSVECTNLGANANNKASSLKWSPTGNSYGTCIISLYNLRDCGDLMGSSPPVGDWNLPRFSSGHTNRISSYKIVC